MYYENFRKCSLKLEEDELNNNFSIYDIKKFKISINALYESVDEYLERQFNILREDCFFHLKEVIKDFRKNNISNVKNLPKDCGLWRYNNVKFSELSIGLFDIMYNITFQTVGKVDWVDSKQLRYGSLLCLSCDNFRSYFLATVSESNINDLKDGLVKIHLIDSPLISDRNRQKQYQMLETQAYYESYIHVLARLQTLDSHSFPFGHYFLRGKTNVSLIKYFHNNVPSITSSHSMDESQANAFKTALTNCISIIQGPPGTGKSTVGFWIIEKLLKCYKDRYSLMEPILVVCYTNHALDQFLEKIQTICDQGDVIRIGSKSDSEQLKRANLTEIVNDWKKEKRFPKSMAVRRAHLRTELNDLKTCLLDEERSEYLKLSDAINYERLVAEFRKCGMEEHLMVLRTAKVIGMTTTASARYANVLSDLRCRIVIIEEAAEVLEAHVICSLNNYCEQLIMIGDHQQLRPTASVRDFEEVYDLNISLFERLIKNKFKQILLTSQRRMRPEISRCIASIYPKLTDHSSVKRFPDVPGFRTNMYLYNHSYAEAEMFETSYKNMHEVKFVKGICDYLLKNGVSGDKITVITTYRGQRYCIKQALKDEKFQPIRVVVVDAYQGEENDVIVLSLVRSNFAGKIGFLKTPNRICVALSRARFGFYIVGNMTCLKSRSALWTDIYALIGSNQGSKIPVTCRKNGNHKPCIKEVEDFYDENRCKDPCGKMLPCNVHVCQKACHSSTHTDCMSLVEKHCNRKLHIVPTPCSVKLVCTIAIITKLLCGHDCEHVCEKISLKCAEKVELTLPCNHRQKTVCGTSVNDLTCEQRFSQTLVCGHVLYDCKIYTGDCNREVNYLRKCGHSNLVKCCLLKLEKTKDCEEKVTVKLGCGHQQKVVCGTDVDYVDCEKRTNQTLPCGHVYIDCVVFTGLCYRERDFERPCGHKKTILCHELIKQSQQKCKEMVKVTLFCAHEELQPCGTNPGAVRCSRRYTQTLSCGHDVVDCVSYSGDCHTVVKQQLPCLHEKEMKCSERSVNNSECVAKCSQMLSCGHVCTSTCVQCFGGRLHEVCQVVCGRSLFCGHVCANYCHPGDCVGCTDNCLLSSMRRLFKVETKVTQPKKRWIQISRSVNKLAMDPIFEEILQEMVKREKLYAKELSNLSSAFVCYEKVVGFTNEIYAESGFDGYLTDYINYVESAVPRIFRWLNPFKRTITKDCVEQLDFELCRLKDIFALCLHIRTNNGDNGVKVLLYEIRNAVYNCKSKELFRRKIAAKI